MGYMRGYPSITNNLAKLLALLEGLKLAKEHNLTPLAINTDSRNIIIMLKFDHVPYDNFVCECNSVMTQLGNQQSAIVSENRTEWWTY